MVIDLGIEGFDKAGLATAVQAMGEIPPDGSPSGVSVVIAQWLTLRAVAVALRATKRPGEDALQTLTDMRGYTARYAAHSPAFALNKGDDRRFLDAVVHDAIVARRWSEGLLRKRCMRSIELCIGSEHERVVTLYNVLLTAGVGGEILHDPTRREFMGEMIGAWSPTQARAFIELIGGMHATRESDIDGRAADRADVPSSYRAFSELARTTERTIKTMVRQFHEASEGPIGVDDDPYPEKGPTSVLVAPRRSGKSALGGERMSELVLRWRNKIEGEQLEEEREKQLREAEAREELFTADDARALVLLNDERAGGW